MFQALIARLRLEKLRQRWTQCDLFDTIPNRTIAGAAGAAVGNALAGTRARQEAARPAPPQPDIVRKRRQRRPNAEDVAVIEQLQEAYATYNDTLFDSELVPIVIRISRRMKNRLGHYMVEGNGLPAEIALSLRHIERDPWDDVLHTLVHEMVHQWQDQHHLPLDHGQSFRDKAYEVGISARATRPANPTAHPRLAARASHRGRRGGK